MPEVIDRTSANLLVQHDDGGVELVSLSPLNRLLFDHNLWGVLRDGTQDLVFEKDSDHPQIRVSPNDDATEYTIHVGDFDAIHLGEHKKSDLVNALREVYRDDCKDVSPLINLFERTRANQVRRTVIEWMGEQEPFATHVEQNSDGWLIKGYLLLTWENEFFHPNTTSRTRNGGIVNTAASERAYDLSVSGFADEMPRELSVDGTNYRLTNAELEFLTRAMWAMVNAPEM